MCSWKGYWDLGPFLYDSFHFPATVKWTGLLYYMFPPYVLCQYRPKTMGPSKNRLKLLKHKSQNKPFLLLSWLSQVFCHSDRKLMTTQSSADYANCKTITNTVATWVLEIRVWIINVYNLFAWWSNLILIVPWLSNFPIILTDLH
jgi:hypothetical protein